MLSSLCSFSHLPLPPSVPSPLCSFSRAPVHPPHRAPSPPLDAPTVLHASHCWQVLLQRYCIPAYFSQDLFRLAGSNRRPPHRWMIFGSGQQLAALKR